MRIVSILALLAWGLPLHAQSWEELRSLKPGDRVNVLDSAGREHKGVFRTVSADAISLRTNTSEEAIERSRVRRVQVRSNSRRLRNVLIGVGIGVAAGVTLDQTLGARLRNEGNQSGRPATYIAPIGLLAGVGAARSANRTVYRAR
jgi:hypothetical protein